MSTAMEKRISVGKKITPNGSHIKTVAYGKEN